MNWTLLAPAYVVAGLAFGAFTFDLIVPRLSRTVLVYGGAATLIITGIFIAVLQSGETNQFAGGILIFDKYSTFFFVLFVALAAVTILGSSDFVKTIDSPGEFVALLMMSAVGAMGMAAAGELITAYISLELLSFSLYILASYTWREKRTNEAGTKYILLGALASAFLLLGISYIYGLTGHTRYDLVAEGLLAGSASPGLIIALAMMTAGLGFKIAAVPFHMWTPDVYEGAPIPVTAYLAAASKAAGFALLIRLVAVALGPVALFWDWIFLLLAVLSMMLGNLVAILQSNLKRLMAYSSIGQVGYLLLGVAALGATDASKPVAGMLIHTVSYGASTMIAFMVILAVQQQTGREGVRDLAGLARRSPYLAMVLTAALFSLAGFPFFIGFASKFYLFTVVATAGPRFLAPVGIAIFASLISLYYYLNIVRQMYIEAPEDDASKITVSRTMWILLAVLLGALIAGGLYVRPLASAAEAAAAALFGG